MSNNVASINQVSEGNLAFKRVLEEVLHRKRLNQRELASRAGVSQPYISRVERGVKPLTEKLAERLAKVLSGTTEQWMQVYTETQTGADLGVEYYLDKLGLGTGEINQLGTKVRQLQKQDILMLFNRENLDDVPENDEDLCEISEFAVEMVNSTSYDLTAGHIATQKDDEGKWIPVPTEADIIIPKRDCLIVGSKEHVKLPKWLEAELSPPASIALKKLFVAHGPIIDPNWDGIPLVSVFNPTEEDIIIAQGKPFLTLRFWVASSSPKFSLA